MGWPVKGRLVDFIVIGFYLLAFFIIYLIEIEQLTIVDPAIFSYPLWPPKKLIDLTHWWGENYHGTLYHRPVWYKATIWFDVLISGPVYLAGIYAFYKKKAWIKYPALIQASMLAIIVLISVAEEYCGMYASEQKLIVISSMLLWIIVPLLIIRRTIRMKIT